MHIDKIRNSKCKVFTTSSLGLRSYFMLDFSRGTNSPKLHSGFTKIVRRLRDSISYGGYETHPEEVPSSTTKTMGSLMVEGFIYINPP